MQDHETIHNCLYLKERRQDLRNNATPPEKTLWQYLKGSQVAGRKFRRQHSVGNYILDFYCPAERLAIELDGAHHFTEEGIAYDEVRTAYINSLHIKVIRFENKEIWHNIEAVLETIQAQFSLS